MAAEDAGDNDRTRRVAYWVALSIFLLLAVGTVLMASLAPMRPDDPPVSQVHSIQKTTGADGRTTTIERTQVTTGDGGGSVFGWTVGRVGVFGLQLVGGLLVAYLISGLVHRAICGHYALKMLGVELPEQAGSIAKAAEEASAAVDERRVLAEDTIADQANLAEGVRPSSEPVDDDSPEDMGVSDIVFGLSDLSTSLSAALRSLLAPPPRITVHGTEDMARILNNRGVLPPPLSAAVARVVRECRSTGTRRNRARLDEAAMTYGPDLLADLHRLRRTAARAFEEHVLDALDQVPRCTVDRGKVLRSSQVDALAERDGTAVVVEVRSRIGPGATSPVDDASEWLRGIPAEVPVLLIVPAEPTSSPRWQEIRNRPGLTVLSWDEEHLRFPAVLTEMLTSASASAGAGALEASRDPAATT